MRPDPANTQQPQSHPLPTVLNRYPTTTNYKTNPRANLAHSGDVSKARRIGTHPMSPSWPHRQVHVPQHRIGHALHREEFRQRPGVRLQLGVQRLIRQQALKLPRQIHRVPGAEG